MIRKTKKRMKKKIPVLLKQLVDKDRKLQEKLLKCTRKTGISM